MDEARRKNGPGEKSDEQRLLNGVPTRAQRPRSAANIVEVRLDSPGPQGRSRR
jgi:hypothetical protein